MIDSFSGLPGNNHVAQSHARKLGEGTDLLNRLVSMAFVSGCIVLAASAFAEDGKKSKQDAAAQTAQPEAQSNAAASTTGSKTLLEAVKAEKGTLKNPYTDNKKAIAEGKKLYFSYSCNGCHGGTGGGGMCPPLSNERWIYGSDDDTLFRLIALGTDKLGYTRKAMENVVGPMMGFHEVIGTEDELWKIIAFVRTTYRGRPERRDW